MTDLGSNDLPISDLELLERFEGLTLPAENFHHREHVRVAFLYLQRYPVQEALQAFCGGLRRFAAAFGNTGLYNETISWAYIFLIQERMARAGKAQNWEEFAENNPDLLTWKDGILSRFYREETLHSELAKEIFVFPDKMSGETTSPDK
jgi:hypothetical protein